MNLCAAPQFIQTENLLIFELYTCTFFTFIVLLLPAMKIRLNHIQLSLR